ncbi:DUF1127 domain-containing protein [Roseospira visakhapatnamensis]|uniref:Uncharacterized protein YjiS (DUF1127 family) n=1 Tax=Roseospira visakhapatnamensis TaxID=390880 RepID=A0A7W6RE16_9PROT|nr:DUF1127 domain-containing protein [Roseospira visakhapatnamensis]MBB4266831.1 uncharacterized protein YjiS (DUF1127 family) [Roseospira visakhapatnamensis]
MWPHLKDANAAPSSGAASADGAVPNQPVTPPPAQDGPSPAVTAPAANDDDHPTPAAERKGQRWWLRLPHRLMGAILAWRERQILKEDLRALDRHQLADIGLTPEDIPAVVDGRYRRHGDGPS